MSDDAIKNEVAEDISNGEEEQLQESEELVENEEVLDEDSESTEESIEEAKASKVDEEEDEVEEEVSEAEEKKETVSVPKTKAGTIQAAVDILKAARKEDAQKMFAKMVSIDGEEESIKSADAAMKGGKKAQDPKAKAKVEAVDFDEDLDILINEEATLSDGFREKAGSIFEAVLTSKLSQEVDRLESEYAQNLEDEVSEVQSGLVEKVDSYLNYVVENWMKENELAVQQGLRTEIAEEFMTSLQQVFKEHYIEVPEGKVDLVDELNESVTELEASLNKSTEENIEMHQKIQDFEKADVVREQSSGLADTEAEKLQSLVEDIEFDNKENFEMKVKTVKESYFTSEVTETADDVDSLLADGEADEKVSSELMSQYTQAITKHTN
tara:strand:- start:2597 stop:3745 length:1149 start_codon:yes stop_codon:yes gene_type:complete